MKIKLEDRALEMELEMTLRVAYTQLKDWANRIRFGEPYPPLFESIPDTMHRIEELLGDNCGVSTTLEMSENDKQLLGAIH